MKQISHDFYKLSAETVTGETFKFSELKGHPVLIVNTATKCGLASVTFKNMKALAQTYKDLRILAFPCDQFFKQEEEHQAHVTQRTIEKLRVGAKHEDLPDNEETPGIGNKDITDHKKESKPEISDNEKVDLSNIPENIIIFKKVNVRGSDKHPVFSFLTKHLQGTLINTVKWNFTKFLIDENGIPMKRYSPTEPVKIDDEHVKGMFVIEDDEKKEL